MNSPINGDYEPCSDTSTFFQGVEDLPKQQSNLGEYRQLNLLTSTVEPSELDRPQFSICPSCASQVIKLADGCGVCGWSEDEKLLGGK